ncbi:MAG: hypothetical protein Q8P72_05950, partial [Candidatus Roizmanbacteria bacterium]|nr:hypothetical protein [Candidatus Roizmanbacteria bacterium]
NELLKEFQWDDYLSSWEKLDHSKTKKQITMNVVNILYYLLMFVELAKIDVVGQAVLNGIPHFNISDPSDPDVI